MSFLIHIEKFMGIYVQGMVSEKHYHVVRGGCKKKRTAEYFLRVVYQGKREKKNKKNSFSFCFAYGGFRLCSFQHAFKEKEGT